MIDSFKRGMRVGIGLLSKSSDEIEAMVQRFVKSKQLKGTKAKAMTKELLRAIKEEKKRLASSLRKDTKRKLRQLKSESREEADRFMEELVELQYLAQDLVAEKAYQAKRRAKKIPGEAYERLHGIVSESLHDRVEGLVQSILGEPDVVTVRPAKRKSTKKKAKKKQPTRKKKSPVRKKKRAKKRASKRKASKKKK